MTIMIISNDGGYQINKHKVLLRKLGDITFFLLFFIHEIIIRVTPHPPPLSS